MHVLLTSEAEECEITYTERDGASSTTLSSVLKNSLSRGSFDIPDSETLHKRKYIYSFW